MTTTPSVTPETPAAPAAPVVAAKPKRPLTLVLAAAAMALLALLSFASPFLPRVGGFRGQQPGAWPPQGGQAPDMRQMPAQGQEQPGQQPSQGQQPRQGRQPGQGGPQGFPGGSTFTILRYLQPIRIGLGVIGGLFALVAALGLWRKKKWGRVLAIIAAVVSLLLAAAAFASPLLGRSAPWLMWVTGSTWPAVAGAALAVLAAVLALLPASRQAYVTAPRDRRVM